MSKIVGRKPADHANAIVTSDRAQIVSEQKAKYQKDNLDHSESRTLKRAECRERAARSHQLPKKQMRPGPATRAALFGGHLVAPFHARGMGELIFHSRSEEHVRRCTRQIAIREANSANQPAALRWPTASPAVCGGLCEEAATPGQPVHAPKRVSGGTLLSIHPRELPGTASSAAMLWQGMQDITLECVSLCALERGNSKRKAMHRCAETVNVRTSLWKLTEKTETSEADRGSALIRVQDS